MVKVLYRAVFCSLYTKWDFRSFILFIWSVEFNVFILHWTVDLRLRVGGLGITDQSIFTCVDHKSPSKLSLWQKSLSFKYIIKTCRLHPVLVFSPSFDVRFPSRCCFSFLLGEEDDKDDKEDDKHEKYLDHQPAVGGNWLKVFEDLCVSGLHVQLGVFYVSIDPVRRDGQSDYWYQTLKKRCYISSSSKSVIFFTLYRLEVKNILLNP